MKDSWITKVAMILVVVLVVWNIYKGVTVQEIGIPGFTFKFNTNATPSTKAPADIDVNGRVVDFDKGELVSNADVRLTIAGTTVSQKTDTAGSFIFKFPGSEGNAVVTLDVVADGFDPFKQNLSQLSAIQDVYLKHSASGGASAGGPVGGLAAGGKGATLAEKEQIQRIAAKLPAYQKRRDFVRFVPHP